MKSPGNDLALLPFFVQWNKSLRDFRSKVQTERRIFEGYLTNSLNLFQGVDKYRLTLEETLWDLRRELDQLKRGGEAWVANLSIEVQNILIFTELDVEFMEDSYVELKGSLPTPLAALTGEDLCRLEEYIEKAESVVVSAKLNFSLADIDRQRRHEIDEDFKTALQYHLTLLRGLPSFSSAARSDRVFNVITDLKALIIRCEYYRNHRTVTLPGMSPAELAAPSKKRAEQKAAEQQAQFDTIRDEVLTGLRALELQVGSVVDDNYMSLVDAQRTSIDRDLKRLSRIVTHGVRGKGLEKSYDQLLADYRKLINRAEQYWTRYDNSKTWWGRFANWLDDTLKLKEPM